MARRLEWFRLYYEARTDKKLSILTLAERGVWMNLLCYASEQDERGTFRDDDREILSLECAEGDEAILASTLEKLQRVMHIIRREDSTLIFRTFERRQYEKPSDSPDATAARKRLQRDRERQEESHATVTPLSREVTPNHTPSLITESESESESESDTDTERGEVASLPARTRAKRATTRIPDDFEVTSELRAVAIAAGVPCEQIALETEQWRDYHAAKGDTVKDAAASWRTWMRNAPTFAATGRASPIASGTPVTFAQQRQRNNDEASREFLAIVEGTANAPATLQRPDEPSRGRLPD